MTTDPSSIAYWQTTKHTCTVYLNQKPILSHQEGKPFLYIGKGKEKIEMYRGNFDIEDYVEERLPLTYIETETTSDALMIRAALHKGADWLLTLTLTQQESGLDGHFAIGDPSYNRFWIRLDASQEERIYGCGEQLSYFNLRGKHFPLWTSEPGVGRNKSTYTTWQADVHDRAGGDYYTTNYPQPTFISTRKYVCHLETTAYADFDFRRGDHHELHVWGIPQSISFRSAPSYLKLAEAVKALFGSQPALPDWVYNGVILGIQGGTEVVEQKIQRALEKGVKIAGVWVQDWQGKRVTSFGKRLMWNWKWNPDEYPELDQKIQQWKAEGIRFMGYINPYLAVEGDLYQEASQQGYLAKDHDGDDYLVDFGEFDCGIVDFTNPDACKWYKEVIKSNLIDFGLDGWMADFGEYLPIDVQLHNGESAMLMHNAWPTLWGRINREAIEEAGKKEEIVYFMRAGYTGIQKECPLLWAGDQSVNWSIDDGLASVIPAALSSGMIGNGLHHSDIGGYTSLHGNKRTRELLWRWVEMAAFTPFMRTHEGNRPDDCFQFDGDDETLEQFARMTHVYTKLAPYIKALVQENTELGIPAQRPLFMHYEKEDWCYEEAYSYLLGRDLFVAPVYKEGQQEWTVRLPEDEWIHMWSGRRYSGGLVTVEAPFGQPPVFYRAASECATLFASLKNMK